MQLSGQSRGLPSRLQAIYASSHDGRQQPTLSLLMTTLRDIVEGLGDTVYIMIDALDECAQRDVLLTLMKQMVDWKLEKLHILATSRNERDIEDSLQSIVTGQFSIQDEIVDADIRVHVRERLQHDSKLKRWPLKVREEIEDRLISGSNGM